MKKFNSTGVCIPQKHYMVDISDKVSEISKMVEEGDYFTINRARQYGKTTTLTWLKKELDKDYVVISLDFQRIGHEEYETESSFTASFCRIINKEIRRGLMTPENVAKKIESYAQKKEEVSINELMEVFEDWIEDSDKPLVLMIDEVDSATNNQVFLDFLAMLRAGYIERDSKGNPAFRSVILAGVNDIRHIKSKIRPDDQSKVNSPWNISVSFDVDMSLSKAGIEGMLSEYEADHDTGMDIGLIAKEIHDYTSGYPFLVSRICKIIDEELVPKKFENHAQAWTMRGMDEAVKILLDESNTLFDSLFGKLENYPEIKDRLRRILMSGERISYSSDSDEISQLHMYGFIKKDNGGIAVSNRIFEMRLYNYFLAEEALKGNQISSEGSNNWNIFVNDGRLDMKKVIGHFIKTYTEVFGPLQDKFKEKDGRELFLLFLMPIINGTGNYYIEAQTRDNTRTDVIVDYLGERHIIELKIWRGESYNEKGEQQIKEYLDYFGIDTGYMLSFNFNKKKEVGIREVEVLGKRIIEGML